MSSTVPPARIALMAPLSNVSFIPSGDVVLARFGALPPDYDDLYFAIDSRTAVATESFDASPSWVTTTQAREIGWDSAPADFPATWLVDGGFYDLIASRDDGTASYFSAVSASTGLRATARTCLLSAARTGSPSRGAIAAPCRSP